jgi:hypothetical protein
VFFVLAYAATRRPCMSLGLLIALQLGNEYLDALDGPSTCARLSRAPR